MQQDVFLRPVDWDLVSCYESHAPMRNAQPEWDNGGKDYERVQERDPMCADDITEFLQGISIDEPDLPNVITGTGGVMFFLG